MNVRILIRKSVTSWAKLWLNCQHHWTNRRVNRIIGEPWPETVAKSNNNRWLEIEIRSESEIRGSPYKYTLVKAATISLSDDRTQTEGKHPKPCVRKHIVTKPPNHLESPHVEGRLLVLFLIKYLNSVSVFFFRATVVCHKNKPNHSVWAGVRGYGHFASMIIYRWVSFSSTVSCICYLQT